MATWTNTDRESWLDVSRRLAADPNETPAVRKKGAGDAVWWEQQITANGGTVPPNPHAAPAAPYAPEPDHDPSYGLEPDAFGAAAGMISLLADPDDGVMRYLAPGSPQWLAAGQVTGLYYRRTDHEEPSAEEWAAAAAEAVRHEDEPGDYGEDDAEGYTRACATLAVAGAAKAGPDPASDEAGDHTESALYWAREAAGGPDTGAAAVMDRKYDAACETGAGDEEAHRDAQRNYMLGGRHDTLVLAGDGAGWDIDAYHPTGWEVEAIGWLREHDMLDKRHHDPDTGETLAEWREGAHTTFTANDRGRHYLGAVAHELDRPVPAASMVACPKCGRQCLLAPLDLDDPDDGDGPRHWHPVADPAAHQGVRMLLSCPQPDEPPADLTGAPAAGTGAASALPPAFAAVVEAWAEAVAAPFPADGAIEPLDAWFVAFAGACRQIGDVLGDRVPGLHQETPLAGALLDHLDQAATAWTAIGDRGDELHGTWEEEHARDLHRQREPRPHEGMLNTV